MNPPTITSITRRLIDLHRQEKPVTLLAVCPNSAAVLQGAVLAASRSRMPLLFAATLNQVDRDGGYTGWTPASFVAEIARSAAACPGGALTGDYWLYPCLDHGGPWLKDAHNRAGVNLTETMTLAETMAEVKDSLSACLEAGYALLHIDPTVDRTLPPGQALDINLVAARTVELIAHVEARRQALDLPPVAYEVGTEEVAGGLVDYPAFQHFLVALRQGLSAAGLETAPGAPYSVWPVFIVGKVGTDLGSARFDPGVARQLVETVEPLGSLVKGHYTDWVENPAAYPQAGMGGANVGPEFTAVELAALGKLAAREEQLLAGRDTPPSRLLHVIETAVVRSGRWRKWLKGGETGREFADLPGERRTWLVQTGARYIWTQPEVVSARSLLYANLAPLAPDPHAVVVAAIAAAIERYVLAFNLKDSVDLF